MSNPSSLENLGGAFDRSSMYGAANHQNVDTASSNSASRTSTPSTQHNPPAAPMERPNTPGTLKQVAVVGSAWAPLSTRGVLQFIGFKVPQRLGLNLFRGIKALVEGKGITGFTEQMKDIPGKLATSWRGGIIDIYKDLKPNDPKAQDLCAKHYRYAAMMCGGVCGNFSESEQVTNPNNRFNCHGLSSDRLDPANPKNITNKIDDHHRQPLANLVARFKAMGFEERPGSNQGGALNNAYPNATEGNMKFVHPETGVIFTLVYDRNQREVNLCFEGVAASDFIAGASRDQALQLFTKARNDIVIGAAGGVAASHLQAMELGKVLKETTANSGLTPVIVGHSHGGMLASIAAAANGVKGVLFNPEPVPASVRRLIGQSNIEKNNIICFYNRGCWVADNGALNKLAVGLERLFGWAVPRTIANQGYCLPCPQEDPDNPGQDPHNNLRGGLNSILGARPTAPEPVW